MVNEFLNFIENHSLITENDKLLLSLSGGSDSVALFKLLIDTHIPFDAAHCNYHLRDEESNRDENFVTDLCKKHNINLFVKHFETQEFASNNNISIEMAARDLRYEWYKELCENYSFTKIATAHHLNDQAETFFINILRNTGLHGICGIPIKRPLEKNTSNNKIASCYIIRPLLFASKAKIMQYIASYSYVIDSTNEKDSYLRNKIRNNITPELEKISPNFVDNLQNSIDRFQYSRSFIDRIIKDNFPQIDSDNQVKIIIPKYFSFEELAGYLYFALYDFGFNFKQLDDIAKTINKVGKKFFSDKYELLIDREFLFVKKLSFAQFAENLNTSALKKTFKNDISIVFENELLYFIANQLDIDIIAKSDTIPTDTNIAYLDYDKVQFPLFITTKKEGDYFYPLGMNKKKKLSDFFIDNKIDQFTKDTTPILRAANNDILWLINHRIDNRYKVDSQTTSVLAIKISTNSPSQTPPP